MDGGRDGGPRLCDNGLSSMLSDAGLTAREHTVASLVCDGLSNKAIARELGLTESTVKMHLANIFRKVGVRGRGALILVSNGQPAMREPPPE